MARNEFIYPGGNRLAVVVSALLETWSEGNHPTYFTRTTPLRAGTEDLAAINWSTFGCKEGIWRLNKVISEQGIPATLHSNAASAELYPEAIKGWMASGHDIGGHAYLQDHALIYMSAEDQRATVKKSLDILESVAGKRPTGWVTPIYGWTEHTRDNLAEEGLLWSCDTMDLSMPRVEERKGRKFVLIPWSDYVDNRARANPTTYFDVYRETFDYLYAYEPGGFLHIGVHAHFGGRPSVAANLHKVLRYIRGFPGVWFTTHRELAEWVLTQPPSYSSYQHRFFGPAKASGEA